MQTAFIGDNLLEMSNLFSGKNKKIFEYVVCLKFTQSAKGMANLSGDATVSRMLFYISLLKKELALKEKNFLLFKANSSF